MIEITLLTMNGRQVKSDCVKSLKITGGLYSPAEGLLCRVVSDYDVGEIDSIFVDAFGGRIFEGKADRQKYVISEKGRVLQIEARSVGALLLDNEAMPCMLNNVSLGTVFNKCAAPYGFTSFGLDLEKRLGVYSIGKGVSEWDAIAGFVKRAQSKSPYVLNNAVCVGAPLGDVLTISNTSDYGINFAEVTHIYSPFKVISEVNLRDSSGNYSYKVVNKSADYMRVKRKRYSVPPGEYTHNHYLDANRIILNSMAERESFEVVVPGIISAFIGQSAQIEDKALTARNLVVTQRDYIADSGGVITVLKLGQKLYSEI